MGRKKNYGIYKGEYIDNFNYLISKGWKRFKILFIWDKKKKNSEKSSYSRTFNDNLSTQVGNEIPNNKYYVPVSFIAFDIIPKERILEFSNGLERLILDHYTKKFLGGLMDEKRIESFIKDMNDYSWSYDAWYDFGRYDFDNNKELKRHIDYFDISVRNFSTSYFSIEIYLYISEDRKKEINEIINRNYIARGHVNKYFSSRHKHIKKRRLISHYNNSTLKSELINNKLIETKWVLFNELQKYFPLTLHSLNVWTCQES